jgi:hypothetical protein
MNTEYPNGNDQNPNGNDQNGPQTQQNQQPTGQSTGNLPHWKPTSERHFFEMLGVVPPALLEGADFLVGEPLKHRTCRVTGQEAAVYAGFTEVNGKYFTTSEGVSRAEFEALRRAKPQIPERGKPSPEEEAIHAAEACLANLLAIYCPERAPIKDMEDHWVEAAEAIGKLQACTS